MTEVNNVINVCIMGTVVTAPPQESWWCFWRPDLITT